MPPKAPEARLRPGPLAFVAAVWLPAAAFLGAGRAFGSEAVEPFYPMVVSPVLAVSLLASLEGVDGGRANSRARRRAAMGSTTA